MRTCVVPRLANSPQLAFAALVLHPIAAGFTIIALLLALFSQQILGFVASLFACLVTVIAFCVRSFHQLKTDEVASELTRPLAPSSSISFFS